MSGDVRAEQQRIENNELARQDETEKRALELLTTKGEAASRQYLTDYSFTNSAGIVAAWWHLFDRLVVKYSNEMVHDA
jgi:dipeptidase